MTASRTVRIAMLAIVLLGATAIAAPSAAAERVTGCLDGWDHGDDDCVLGDHDLEPRCLAFRECGPPS